MLKYLFLFFRKSIINKTQLILENIFLRKQLEIYQRSNPKVKIKKTDRLFFSLIKESLFNWRKRLFVVKPETVIKWHRTAFRIHWKLKSKLKEGRPKINWEVINLIKQMAKENPL
jgi:hypothetical protein